MSAEPVQLNPVTFRLDAATRADAERLAAAQGTSLSVLIRRGLRRELGMPESFVVLDLERGGGWLAPHESRYGGEGEDVGP